MLVVGFPAGPWGTNCYVVATGSGQECLVVDPGKDAGAGIAEAVREHGLQPVAVLLTHGHLDHVWSVVPVCGDYGVPAYLHPLDEHLLAAEIELAGLAFTVDHAPGHTRGSVMFRRPAVGEVAPLLFSGDVLFEGSIGRTDLPGGDHLAMLSSLRTKVLPLEDATVVLPGHGSQTTIARERNSNPYLLELSSFDLASPPLASGTSRTGRGL